MDQLKTKVQDIPEYLAQHLCDVAQIDATSLVLVLSDGQNILNAISERKPKEILSKTQSRYYNRAIIDTLTNKTPNVNVIVSVFDKLQINGILVAMVDAATFLGTDKSSVMFKNLLIENKAEIKELPNGAFQEDGLFIKALILRINK